MGLADLPNAKWDLAGSQPICKEDFQFIEGAILEAGGGGAGPDIPLIWVDAASVKVLANADSPAKAFLNGFPNIMNFGEYLDFGLTDMKQRTIVSDVAFHMAVAATLWGTEAVSQLYAIFAIAGDSDTTFTLKAMPFCTVKDDATYIRCGTHGTPATAVDYGFVEDEFIGGMVYVLSGGSRGLARTITANDDDGSGATTITYGGAGLSLAAGDSFIILPSDTNFAYLGCLFNNSAGHIVNTKSNRKSAAFEGAGTYHWIILAPIHTTQVVGRGGGGGGGGTVGAYGGGGYLGIGSAEIYPGEIFKITTGSGGAAGGESLGGTAGGATTIYTALGNKVFPGGTPGLGDGTPGIGIFGVVSNGYGDGGDAGYNSPGYVAATAGIDGCVYLSW